MSARMLDLLLRQWPGKVALTPEEVAVVLSKQPETIRDKMREGSLPGAKKQGGRWVMPLPDLADYIEPPQSAPPLTTSSPVKRTTTGPHRRRAVVMNYRTDIFWGQVAKALGEHELYEELIARAEQAREQYVMEFLAARAERRRAQLMAIAGLVEEPPRGRQDIL